MTDRPRTGREAPLEIEARFRAAGRDALDRLARAATLGHASVGEPRTSVEEDRYLDTVDGRLAGARWACRLRSRHGVTVVSLKGPPDAATTGWLHRRPEVEGPATPSTDPASWPASPARERLLALTDGGALNERLRLHQVRTERRLVDGAGEIGVLSLDEVEVRVGDSSADAFYIVELEVAESRETELDALAPLLAQQDGLVAEPRTKLEIALALAG